MNSSNHLKFLIFVLIVLGIGIPLYQVFVLHTPLKENKLENVWTVDVRINFDMRKERALALEFYLPPPNNGFEINNELFIANGYGQSIFEDDLNRQVVWTARKVKGKQTIFYRFNLNQTAMPAVPKYKGETWRMPIEVPQKNALAVETLVLEIRQKSVDISSFITTAINKVHDGNDSNIKFLLGSDTSPENKLRLLEILLSQAHIPIQTVHALNLAEDGNHQLELWIRSYIEREKNTSWYYFNITTAAQGLPANRLIWWVGDNPIINGAAPVTAHVDFSVVKNELTLHSLEKLSNKSNFSLYSLPITTQIAYQLMLMIPFGVLIILIVRNIVGIDTLGTFTPVLIALAFRDTGLVFGIVFFSIIMCIGLLMRAYLEHLKLQMLPRLSIVLTFVIIMIIVCSMLSFKLGFTKGLSITLFPMVILTMSIERLSITREEQGAWYALRVWLGSLVAATCVFVVLDISYLIYFVFTFPAILLAAIAFMLVIGRYRGYRLLELGRFKALLKKG